MDILLSLIWTMRENGFQIVELGNSFTVYRKFFTIIFNGQF